MKTTLKASTKASSAVQPATKARSSKSIATAAKTKSITAKKKSDFDALATCPVNGAGWCPYPFSIAQLKRRLKAKAAAEAAAKATRNL